jgi:hypothetical protein
MYKNPNFGSGYMPKLTLVEFIPWKTGICMVATGFLIKTLGKNPVCPFLVGFFISFEAFSQLHWEQRCPFVQSANALCKTIEHFPGCHECASK